MVYAEGSGETTGVINQLRAPGVPLDDDSLGSAHILMRRLIALVHSIAEGAIVFEEPLRTGRGRLPKGSDLHHEKTLAQLLTWPHPSRRPDVAIVLVDCDGDNGRKARLAAAVSGLPGARVIGMAVQEFEAWLIADQRALAGLFGTAVSFPGPPQLLKPAEAKQLLAAWCGQSSLDGSKARRTLAATSDLDEIAKACSAFAGLRGEISTLSL